MNKSRLLGAVCACLITNTVFSATFTPLGTLAGDINSSAYAISADGTTVVGSSSATHSSEAFYWTQSTGMVGLGYLSGGDGTTGRAHAVSADGSVIVGTSDSANASNFEAFRWTSSTGMVGLGDLPGGQYYSQARGISADGLVIAGLGHAGVSNRLKVTLWPDGGDIMDLGGGSGYGISADGSTVVGTAGRWTDETGWVSLGNLPGGSARGTAYAASEDGSVVVGSSTSSYAGGYEEAFRWTDATGMIGLGALPGGSSRSEAFAVSADGSVIVGNSYTGTTASSKEAFLWTATDGMVNLLDLLIAEGVSGLDGWTLFDAKGISADGLAIVGRGLNPSGNVEAYVVNLSTVPIPPALWLFCSGLLGLVGMARRKVHH